MCCGREERRNSLALCSSLQQQEQRRRRWRQHVALRSSSSSSSSSSSRGALGSKTLGQKRCFLLCAFLHFPFFLSLLPFLLFRGRGNVFLISLRFSAEEREREDESNCCARFSDAATVATAAAAVGMRAVQWRGSPLAKGKHFRRRRVKKREKTRISHSPLFLLPSWTPFPHVYLCVCL